MKYRKTVEFFAAHFNETAYEKWKVIQDPRCLRESPEHIVTVMTELLLDIHGHNFKAEVEIVGYTGDDYSGYLISDEDIEATVKEWHGINLSVHPDFEGIRATTENMATMLAKKLWPKIKSTGYQSVNVTIHESDDISATDGLQRNGNG